MFRLCVVDVTVYNIYIVTIYMEDELLVMKKTT